MSVYYNENDPKAAAWLRELIKGGHIAAGDVDDRSIEEVKPGELVGYRQHHFFSGIGGWSYALRLAGWPDDREVWTGSCPCQPFSVANSRRKAIDHRDLWHVWYELIRKRKPPVIFGEQVASPMAVGSRPKVSAKVSARASRKRSDAPLGLSREAQEVAVRLARTGDSGPDRFGHLRGYWSAVQSGWRPNVGQPFLRSRGFDEGLYNGQHARSAARIEQRARRLGRAGTDYVGPCDLREAQTSLECLVEAIGREAEEQNGWISVVSADLERAHYTVGACDSPAAGVGAPHIRQRLYWVALGDTSGSRSGRDTGAVSGAQAQAQGSLRGEPDKPFAASEFSREVWRRHALVSCTDGKHRPVESGSFPLAYGFPERVGLLRGYGNAIVPQLAATFIEAVMS